MSIEVKGKTNEWLSKYYYYNTCQINSVFIPPEVLQKICGQYWPFMDRENKAHRVIFQVGGWSHEYDHIRQIAEELVLGGGLQGI